MVGDGHMARTRAGICPPAETIATLDAIVQDYLRAEPPAAR